MTPVDPTGGDAQASERIASTLELLAKAGGILGMLWAFLAKVAKPLIAWWRESQAKTIRTVLAPQLEKLDRLIEQEDGCTQRMERVLERVGEVFEEFDLVMAVTTYTQERQDETNDLLDEVFALDRRIDPVRRKRVEEMIQALHERRLGRRREVD